VGAKARCQAIALPTASAPAAEKDASDIHIQIPRTVSEWGRGALLFDGLGDFHRKATTSSAEAQKFFDQGMRFLWAFNHDESTRSLPGQPSSIRPALSVTGASRLR